MRYNFHEMLAKIKANPAFVLPGDINTPIIAYLQKLQCEIGERRVKALQEHVGYGGIELFHDDTPNAKITIEVAAGMVGERREYVIEKAGKWTCISYKNVKNSNLDKRNLNKGERK